MDGAVLKVVILGRRKYSPSTMEYTYPNGSMKAIILVRCAFAVLESNGRMA